MHGSHDRKAIKVHTSHFISIVTKQEGAKEYYCENKIEIKVKHTILLATKTKNNYNKTIEITGIRSINYKFKFDLLLLLSCEK